MKAILIETADGVFTAHFSECGLARLDFPAPKRSAVRCQTLEDCGQPMAGWGAATARALEQALRGCGPAVCPPLDLAVGTEFQRSVWEAMRAIPTGMTRSYLEIAQAIGRPKAVRAVGQACGANPIPILIPCHRVLAAHGKLGGFSGGLDWKIKLLGREGASYSPFKASINCRNRP